MSIYIPGKRMPQNCAGCDFCADGWCYVISADQEQPGDLSSDKRPDWCPLVEVPPHGALKDADALRKKWMDVEAENGGDMPLDKLTLHDLITEGCVFDLDKAPTIIPPDMEELK